jgi:hypothetical protein
MTVAKSMVVKHLFSLMKTMDNDDGKTMNLVLVEVFADPLRYSEKFSRIDKELADTDEDDAAKAEPPAVDGACESPLASLCKGLSKAGHFAGELLLDLYGGEFDVTLKTLAGETLIQSILGLGTSDTLGALGPKLREFMRLASPVLKLAVSDSSGAPALSMRCLARIGSEPGGVSPEEKKEDIMRERQQLWVKAQNQRKRFCRYVVCNT